MRFKSLAATSRLLHRTIDYSYDALSRLLQADYNNGTVHTYGFDVAGNLTNMNGTTRIYNAANQMTDDGTNTLTFDDNGNMTSDGVNSYTWDRANRLLLHAGTSYAYDGNSNRISQTVSSVVTEYLVDTQPALSKVLRESDSTNTTHFIHAPRGIHAQYDGTDWTYTAQDALGSVRAAFDDTAAIQQSVNYFSIGVPDSSYDGFAFTGEQRDANGLQYHRARYYDAGMGGFLSLDPFEGMHNRPMSLNGYSWVEGNPVMNIDPSGMCSDDDKECLDKVIEVESSYDNVLFYWKERNLPCRLPGCGVYPDLCRDISKLAELDCPGIEYIRKLCGDGFPVRDYISPGYSTDILPWTSAQVSQIEVALRMLSKALTGQEDTMLSSFTDRVLLLNVGTDTGLPAYTTRNLTQEFALVRGQQIYTDIAISFYEVWRKSFTRDNNPDSAYATWVAIHEFGHVIANKVGGYDDNYGGIATGYRDKRFRESPTNYSTSGIEVVIEAITGVIWNATYSMFGFSKEGAGITSPASFGYNIHQYRRDVCDIQSAVDEQTLNDWIMEKVFSQLPVSNSNLGNCSNSE